MWKCKKVLIEIQRNIYSGKTSLLLNYAASVAKENRIVLYLCNKKKIQQSNPVFPNENHPQFASIMNRIKIKCVLTWYQLIVPGILKTANLYEHILQTFTFWRRYHHSLYWTIYLLSWGTNLLHYTLILSASTFTGLVASPTGSATRSYPGVTDIAKSLALLRDSADYFTSCL